MCACVRVYEKYEKYKISKLKRMKGEGVKGESSNSEIRTFWILLKTRNSVRVDTKNLENGNHEKIPKPGRRNVEYLFDVFKGLICILDELVLCDIFYRQLHFRSEPRSCLLYFRKCA